MKIRRDASGQPLVLAALCVPVVIGFLALAIDAGSLFHDKRNLQIAADAAATAGALDLSYKLAPSPAALTAAQNNGVTDGVNGAVVTVNSPPLYGPNAGGAEYVEVIITQPNPTFFMRMFHLNSLSIKARSVAGFPSAGQDCGYVMNSQNPAALDLQGAYNVQSPGCGWYVNSSSADAVKVTGNGGTFNALNLDVVGGTSGHGTNPTTVTTGVAAQTNPFGNNFNGPTPPSDCTSIYSSSTTLTGTYAGTGAGGVACFTQAVTLKNVTMGAGMYFFENGVTLSGTDHVNSGTLDIYGGTFSQGNAGLYITAPTTGTYNGIALMQPASNTNLLQVQFGSSTGTLDGIIYAPGAELYLQDNGGGLTAAGFVVDSMKIKSSALTLTSYNQVHPFTSPLKTISMVE